MGKVGEGSGGGEAGRRGARGGLPSPVDGLRVGGEAHPIPAHRRRTGGAEALRRSDGVQTPYEA